MSSYIWTDSAWVKDGNGKPVVVLFGRDPDTLETKKLGVKGFVPYFYAEAQDVNYDAISCFGDHIVKIKVDTPDRVPIERQLYAKTFEADIPFDVRYTIDQRIFYAFDDDGKPTDWKGTFTPKIGFWDIEVKAPRTVMPQAKNPKYPITCMSLCDSYSNIVYVFTWNDRQVDIEYEDFNIIHIPCTSEQMVLTMFAQKVHELDFDVMTAWNGQSFDDPYYVKRAQVLDVSLHNLARLSHSWISERRWQGRVLVDMMKLFIDWSKPMGKMPFGLKYIAKEFADFEYDDQGANIESLMDNDKWEEIVEYSAKDVIAMYKINEAVGLFPFFENIRRVMGVKLNDVLSRSVMIETLLAKRGIKPMPTRTYAKDAESAQGATVLKPVPGVHGDVGVVDAKCVDDITEVLTNNGWKLISNLTSNDTVATLNTDTNNIEYESNYEITEENYSGIMYNLDKKFVDWCITPNHRILFKKRNSERQIEFTGEYWNPEYMYLPVEELKERYTGLPLVVPYFGTFEGRKQDYIQIGNNSVGMKEFMKYIGLWIADGHYTTFGLGITQCRKEHMEEVNNVVSALGIKFTENVYDGAHPTRIQAEHRFNIFDRSMFEYVTSMFGNVTSKDKFIPRQLLDLDKEYLIELFNGLMLGDGSATGYAYSTKSKQLADDMQELCFKIGLHGTARFYDYGPYSSIYNVGISQPENRSLTFKGKEIVPIHYDGKVYCLTTRNSNFVMRRNGKVCITGNSLYPTIIIMHNISPDIDNMIPITIVEMMEEREKLRKIRMAGDADEFMKNSETAIKYIVNAFYGYMLFRGARLFDKKCGAQVTREGRKIIKLIGDHIERLGYSVLYGDTDSTFAKGIRIPEDGMSMEVSINDFLKVWAMEQGVREEFVPTVKFEKLYSRIMFKVKATKYKRKSSMAAEPAKKRYAGHLVWKDGFAIDKMDFVGLEIKRSDNSALTRKAMVEFFEVALTNTDVSNAVKIVKKYYNDVLDGKVSISEAGIPKGVDINKKGAWQTGMEHGTELLGIRWSETPKPKLLHTLRPYKVISIDDDVVELPDHIVVNWELMAEKIVKKKFESLLMSIGITWDAAINGQKTLESWF